MRRLVTVIIMMLVMIPNMIFAAERVSLGFLYNSSDSINLVRRTNGSINEVAPTLFDISEKGNLVLNGVVNEKFILAMKEDNIKVTPFLSNHWSRSKGKAALNNKEKLVEQIVNVIEKYDFDGINIDIENLTSNDKDEFSEFVRLLREKLSKNRKLTVSVAANPNASDDGWQGSYDYQVLGEIADYLFIMTYDEHSIGGAEGPVASADFVERSILYALRYVDKSKIVLGIPLYGRYWKNGADLGGEAIVIGDVKRVVLKFKGKIEYNDKYQTAKANFYVPQDSTLKVNGNVLEEGNYTIWYENEDSIKYKLELVNKYNLKGAGVWALGQENVDVWKYYKNALNEAFIEEAPVQLREMYETIKYEIEKGKDNKEFNIRRIKLSHNNEKRILEIIPKRYENDNQFDYVENVNIEKKIIIKRKTIKEKIFNIMCRKVIK